MIDLQEKQFNKFFAQQKPGADAEKIAVFREGLGNVAYSGGAAQACRYLGGKNILDIYA